MKKTNGVIWGVVLVIAGILMLLAQQNIIQLSWGMIWPCGILLISIMFHVQFFLNRKHSGTLVPAGIFLVLGSFFLYNQMTNWGNMEILWPIFILAPGFGLLEQKLFSGFKDGSWIPIIVLFSIGTFFLIKDMIGHDIALAAALIIAGGAILLTSVFGKKKFYHRVNVVDSDGNPVVDVDVE